MSLENLPSPTKPAPEQIKFHQIKGSFFRVIHADGAWLSVHPNEFIHLTFYNERLPIANEVVHNLTETNQLGSEDITKRVTKKGFVREMEVDVVLNRVTAQALRNWLNDYLNDALPKGKMEMI
jgi:hypothetical protein